MGWHVMKIERICIKTYENIDFISMTRPGKYGNPFSCKSNSSAMFKSKTRLESIESHLKWLENENYYLVEELIIDMKSLNIDKLGCYCSCKQTCHVDNYIHLINKKKYHSIF